MTSTTRDAILIFASSRRHREREREGERERGGEGREGGRAHGLLRARASCRFLESLGSMDLERISSADPVFVAQRRHRDPDNIIMRPFRCESTASNDTARQLRPSCHL